MYVVLGATGHVGSVVARSLLDRGEAVTIVTRSPDKARYCEGRGARAAVLDVGDADALRAVLPRGGGCSRSTPWPTRPIPRSTPRPRRSAPPRDRRGRRWGGPRAGGRPVDLRRPGGRADRRPGHAAPLRGGHLRPVHARGVLAWRLLPQQLGRRPRAGSPRGHVADDVRPGHARPDGGARRPRAVASGLLTAPEAPTGARHVEGPRRYSPQDVADAFAAALGRPVEVAVTPRSGWVSTFRGLGFSDAGVESYAGMTAAVADGHVSEPTTVIRGTTALEEYVGAPVSDRPHSDHDTRP